MPFSRPSLSSLQTQALADIAAALPTGQPLPNSILRVLALVQAAFAAGHYGYLDWISKQAIPYTSSGEYLEAWAALKGIARIGAAFATGSATFQGIAGSIVPAGTVVTRGDGVTYTVNADVAVVGTSATVALTASAAGTAGNAATAITLTLAAPISGMTSIGVAASALTGGTEVEEDESLRARMNQAYAAPPQGGSETDYITWALAVPGVTRAWARANGGGAGTVVVYTMFDVVQAAYSGFPQGSNGAATLETRAAPATGNQLTVANYIHPLRPATALVYSYAPAPQVVNVTLANLSPNTAAIQTNIQAALRDLFVRVGTPIGGFLFPSDINAAIESVSGIDHFTLASPVAPVTTLVGSLPVLGSLTVS